MRFVLVLCLPAFALAGPSGHFINDVGIDSLRQVPLGIAAYLQNFGPYYATTNTRLIIEDSTGAIVYWQSRMADIPGGDSVTLVFVLGLTDDFYVARCSVAYRADENPENDTASLRFEVRGRPDVRMTFIGWPHLYVDSGVPGCPSIGLSNRGSAATDFTCCYFVESDYLDSVHVEDFAPHEDTILRLPEWVPTGCGWHPTQWYLTYDSVPVWTIPGSIYIRPGGAVAEPRPSSGREPVRLVPAPAGFVLYGPAEALDNARVIDPTGRVLAVTRRLESDRLQVTGLSPGVYFVRTEGPRGQGSEDTSLKLVLAR